MPHLPQPARARGRAMAPVVHRAKRPVPSTKAARAESAPIAMSEIPEAAPKMHAASEGEN